MAVRAILYMSAPTIEMGYGPRRTDWGQPSAKIEAEPSGTSLSVDLSNATTVTPRRQCHKTGGADFARKED